MVRQSVFVRIDAVRASFLSGNQYAESTSKDPFLTVRLGSLSFETSAVKDSLEPEWQRRYAWPLDEFVEEIVNKRSAFDIRVANKNIFRSSFMGGYVAADDEVREWLDEVVPESLIDTFDDRIGELTLGDVGGDDVIRTRTFRLLGKKAYKTHAKRSSSRRNRMWAEGYPDRDDDEVEVVGVVVLALSLGNPPATQRSSVVADDVLERINAALGPGSDVEAKYDSHGRVLYVDHANASVTYAMPPGLEEALNAMAPATDDAVSSVSSDSDTGSDTVSATMSDSESDSEAGYAGAPAWWATRELGPLPPGWESGTRGTPKVYYINHGDHKTTWDDPRIPPDVGELEADVQQVLLAAKELEAGWERRVMSSGRLYYVNIAAGQSQWNKPGAEVSELEELHDEVRGAFPPGWERKVMANGTPFYVNHLARETSWADPRLRSSDGTDGGEGPSSAAPSSAAATDFQSKLATLREELPTVSGETIIQVSRERVFEDAYQQVMALDSRALKRYFRVHFSGEAGLDYGGLSREFFSLLSQSMFSPFYGLFEYCGSDTGTLQINADSGLVADDHLRLFRFIGRTIGLAIRNGKLMEAYFTSAFYKHVLGRPGTLHDMQSYDLETYNSLAWASSNSIDNILFETFSVITNTFGVETVVDLIDGGRDIDVTDDNKARYIGLLMNYYLFDSVAEQMTALRAGISDVFDLGLLQRFDSKQLEYLISGLGEIDVDDWEAHTQYSGPYSASHKQIRWFWAIVRSFSTEERSRLLSFATGTTRVPLGGFAHLIGSNGPTRFEISVLAGATSLPVSHTCFNRIDLPVYPSRGVLESKLRLAIMETAGFSNE